MDETAAVSTGSAFDWGDTFKGLLNKTIDTASAYAVQRLQVQQQGATNAATGTTGTGAAPAVTPTTGPDWQKILLYGGIAVAAVAAIVIVIKVARD